MNAPTTPDVIPANQVRDLVKAAIRIAADAPKQRRGKTRTLVKRSLIEDLRFELDGLGFGDDWRTLHDIVRAEERIPQNGKAL